jgi:nucleoside-diphosphate-sugar epimerase
MSIRGVGRAMVSRHHSRSHNQKAPSPTVKVAKRTMSKKLPSGTDTPDLKRKHVTVSDRSILKAEPTNKRNRGPKENDSGNGTPAASPSETSKGVVFVTGGTGTLARSLIVDARKSGMQVVAMSRKDNSAHNTPDVEFVQVPEDAYKGGKNKKIQEIVESRTEGVDQALFVNMIGTPHAPKGSFEKVIVTPLVTTAEAFKNGSQAPKNTYVNYGSITASFEKLVEINEYAAMRELGDRELLRRLECEDGRFKAVALRLDMIFTPLGENNMVDWGHNHGPENFAAMPFHPIISSKGKGAQLLQPAYAGDVTAATLNAPEASKSGIVDVVGPQSMTQEEVYSYFVEKVGKTFKPVYIPIEIAEFVAKYAPDGHCADFAIEYLKLRELHPELNVAFDHTPFEQLAGRPLSTLDTLYANAGDLQVAKAKILPQVKKLVLEILKNPKARAEFIPLAKRYGIAKMYEVIRAFISK